jgi:transcriptional regulator with XRE-family HTH domain
MTRTYTVREARQRLEPPLTQEALAAATGVDQTYISLLERGLREPSARMRANLANALGLPETRLRFLVTRVAILALAFLMSTAGLAQAAEPPQRLQLAPYVALMASQGADTWSTLSAFHRGCQEGNTALYGAQPSPARLVATKAAVTVGLGLGMRLLERRGHARLAKVLAYSGAGLGTFAVVNNVGCGR